jgi:hypothetical protein
MPYTRWIGSLAVAAGLVGHLHAQTPPVSEEEIKAAFLYNFAKYVKWPAHAFPEAKLRICTLSDASFTRKVDLVISGERVDGRAVVRPPTPPLQDLARACHILFVASAEQPRVAEVLAAVHRAPVLTVGEAEAFRARGGMITFVKDGDRVRFDINQTEAERVGLAISSRLLRLARRVGLLEEPLR